jgi:hypothetical protein
MLVLIEGRSIEVCPAIEAGWAGQNVRHAGEKRLQTVGFTSSRFGGLYPSPR